MSSLPLSPYTVLDLTTGRSGPTAVRQLADWGARAIHIESPSSSVPQINSHRWRATSRICTATRRASPSTSSRAKATRSSCASSIEPTCSSRTTARRDATARHRVGRRARPQSACRLRQHLGLRPDRALREPPGLRSDRARVQRPDVGDRAPGQGPVRAGTASPTVRRVCYLACGVLTALLERNGPASGVGCALRCSSRSSR
jgi:hypothetical protein